MNDLIGSHSAAVEAHGGKALDAISRIIHTASQTPKETTNLLSDFQVLRQSLRKMIGDMKWIDSSKINPNKFFWKLRPYFAGWDAVQPHGVRYLHQGNESAYHTYRGISAAQSSLFAALDIFFGIEHRVQYLKEMRMHMPKGHREFLADMEEARKRCEAELEMVFSSEPIKGYVLQCRKLLAAFREVHLRLAKKYAVEQASLGDNDVAFGLAKAPEDGGGVLGAGGTELVSFLSSMIDRTRGV